MRQVFFVKDSLGGYAAEVPSLPGCTSQGRNLSEAIINTKQAIYAYLDRLNADGQPIPESTKVDRPKAEGMFEHAMQLREDVIDTVRAVFPAEALDAILAIVDEYGPSPSPETVQIAAIRLSEGNTEKLRGLISDARRDYRDVLSWYALKFGRYP